MSRPKGRLVRVLLIVILLIILAVGVWGIMTVRRSFPQVNGTVQLPGLEAPVEVYRDKMGVPHIYASSEHDLFMAQGFVHAQDRFFQMDFSRHIGSGRLSEMIGESQLDTDRFLRTLGWARVAQQELDSADEEIRVHLQAYAEGVNAYLEDHTGGSLSLEYVILGLLNPDYEPEPWKPLHTLTWAKVMAWDLGGNMSEELLRARLVKLLGPERANELIPPYPQSAPIIVPAAASAKPGGGLPDDPSLFWLPDLGAIERRVASLDSLLGGRFGGLGSNNWTLSGERTSTGSPILANDPHLSIQMPAIWYEIGLHCQPLDASCPYDVTGFSFAGAPGVIIGHNQHIAWGVTNVGPDVQDLFIEKVNPANPNQYMVNGEWVDMTLVQELIQVAGSEPVPITIRYTRHGPVISDVDEDIAALAETTDLQLPTPFVVSLRWTALDPSFVFRAVLDYNKANDWDDFRQALRDFAVPSQNFVYADVEGNIGYQMPGLIPIRAGGDGRLPSPGWTDEYEWTGYIPFDELPSSFNPPQGFIVTANNAVVGPEYPYMISLDWSYGYRASRIIELLKQDSDLSVEDVAKIQGDNHHPLGPRLVPLLASQGFDNPDLDQAADLLLEWDFQNDADSAPAALFNAFWRHLILNTFGDELDPDDLPRDSQALVVVEILIEEPQNAWWDDVTTAETEDRDDALRLALTAAVEELKDTLGKDFEQWAWGSLHTATFPNGILGKSGIAPIEALFNRGPFPVSGGSSIVNATGWAESESYEVRTLPSMRMVVDLSDFRNSLTIHTTGQSGHAYHPHYIDMTELWSGIRFHPMLWTRQQVEAEFESVLTLQP